MPTPTYVPLATITLASTASSVTFSSIPATYRDLVLVMNARITASVSAATSFAYFNGDTGANYTCVSMQGRQTGASVESSTEPRFDLGRIANSSSGSTTNGANIIQIMDYSATDKHKTGLARGNNLPNESLTVIAVAARWASTAAINSIEIDESSGTSFAIGSTFSLYGIAA
jgi:hypothetical protein